MLQPPDYEIQGESNKVCKLKKSIMVWSNLHEFDKFSILLYATACGEAPLIVWILLLALLFLQFMLIILLSPVMIINAFFRLKTLKFSLQYDRHWSIVLFSSIEVVGSKKGFSWSQWKYIINFLEESGISRSKPIDTAMGTLWLNFFLYAYYF